MSSNACVYTGVCSGCSWIGLPYHEQVTRKQKDLGQIVSRVGGLSDCPTGAPDGSPRMSQLGFQTFRANRSRDRVDLSYESVGSEFKLGLFSASRMELVDLHSCPQMSEALEKWFFEFRQMLKPGLSNRISFRLRVGPSGNRGVWMDMANLSIKNLLDEDIWLRSLLDRNVVVELGQKRKRLILDQGKLRLRSYLDGALLESWSSTLLGEDEVALLGAIGGFSQPGREVNFQLVALVREFVRHAGGTRWLEVGCGNGNLSFPLADNQRVLRSTDFDEIAIHSALMTLEKNLPTAQEEKAKLEFVRWNYLSSFGKKGPREAFDGVLVDPPRSGLGKFQSELLSYQPAAIVYISCFAETWESDVRFFIENGYKLEKVTGLDMFPSTEHMEIISLLKRKI